MTTTELEAPRLALPPVGWTDPLVRRYVAALVRYHEERCRGQFGADVAVCNRLERLLGIEGGVR